MDRLELVPGDVRGGGNITLPKSPDFRSDKNTSMCDTYLTERFVPIAENDFQYVYRSISSSGLHISCDAPRRVSSGDSVTVNVSVLRNDSIVSDTSVTLMLRSSTGETVFYEETVTIDSSQPVFTVSIPDDVDTVCEWFVRAYHVDYQGANWHRGVVVVGDWDFDFNVFADKSIVQSGDVVNVVGVLTGDTGESVIGIPGQTVTLYQLFTPGLRVSAPIVQVGDTVDITAQLIDTATGGVVPEEGVLIKFFGEQPLIDDGSVDRSSEYYSSGESSVLSYDSSNHYYVLNRASYSDEDYFLDFAEFSEIPETLDIKVKLSKNIASYTLYNGLVGITNKQHSKGIFGGVSNSANGHGLGTYDGIMWNFRNQDCHSGYLDNNVDYTYHLHYEDGTVTLRIVNEYTSTVVFTASRSYTLDFVPKVVFYNCYNAGSHNIKRIEVI